MIYDAIIIGGGPAGLMAANQFEKHHINYLLLEKNEKCGKKLLLTGGKRCNVTNRLPLKEFIQTLTFKHKRFLYPALSKFNADDVLSFFKTRQLDFVLENNFKYFPKTEKSQSVLDALLKDIKPHHIHFNQAVKALHHNHDIYSLKTKDKTYQAKHVIVATGSNSFPTTGSSGDGLIFAKHLGINYFDFTPAETHIYSEQIKSRLKALQGVSLKDVLVKIKNTKITHQGDLLFTHFGLSGPVIMHLSEFIDEDIRTHGLSTIEFPIIDMHQDQLYQKLINQKTLPLHKVLHNYTTKRIVETLLSYLNIESKKILEMKKKDLYLICETFTSFKVKIDHVEQKERAYVNKGGIDTLALNPKTMEVKAYPGLYFIGETTDLHGPIGGYNITIALSTGYISSHHIITKIKGETHGF